MQMYSNHDGLIRPPSANRPSNNKKWYKKWWGGVLVAFFTLLLVLLVAFLFQVLNYRSQLADDQSAYSDLASAANRLESVRLVSLDDPTLGPKDAKVVVVEFSDFQCPFCSQVFPVVKELTKEYSDRVLFVYKDFPLIELHPQAVIAALAGQCALEQGKFWPMHDLMFTNQENLQEADLKKYAVQIGLNSLQFNSCLQSNKYLGRIQADFDLGLELGVKATPTFFINGRGFEGAAPLSEFEQVINQILSSS